MRLKSFLPLLLLVTATLSASVRFVSPLPNSQTFGAGSLEVTTSSTSIDRVEFRVDGRLIGVARQQPYRVPYDFGDEIASHEITATVFSDGFRTRETATVRTAGLTHSDAVTIDLVEVPLRVESGGSSLRPSDLVVTENGVRQQVTELLNERPPTSFFFVIDRSLSIKAEQLAATINGVHEVLPFMKKGDDASVVMFNHRVDPPRVVSRTRSLAVPDPSGGTALRDALASLKPSRRSVVIAISDGGDRNSELSESDAQRTISRGNVTVYGLVRGSGRGSEFLKKAASSTGGFVIDGTGRNVSTDLKRIFDDVNSRYLMTYQSRGSKKGWREIAVRPARSAVSVKGARKRYFAG